MQFVREIGVKEFASFEQEYQWLLDNRD